MPIIIFVLTVAGGIIWWWVRNNPREAIDAAQDLATIARNAPRKLAFRKQLNAHPVEGIDDPNIAVCGIAQAFIELDDLPTREQRAHLHVLLRSRLRVDEDTAQEMEVLGRWLQTQCNGPLPAISRLGRRLYKLNGDGSWEILQDILGSVVTGEISESQKEAIAELRRVIHR